MLPTPAELVARYLRSNGYDETLKKFIEEADLDADVGSTTGTTIEQVLQEKKTFDRSLNFEKLSLDETRKWQNPAPSTPNILNALPTKSNIISACMLDLIIPGATEPKRCIAATTADRQLNLIDPVSPSFPLLSTLSHVQDSPVLDLAIVGNKFLLAGSMSGALSVYNTTTDKITDTRKDHSKYVVKIATWCGPGVTIVATAGWDSKVHFYKLTIDGESARFGEPLATLSLQTLPETIAFINPYKTERPLLLLSRRDSTRLHYYGLKCAPSAIEVSLLGTQNLAPHSNAWIVFSPSDIQVCPTDPSIAAIATSSTPHMKLLIVRLLVPRDQHEAAGFGGNGTQQAVGASDTDEPCGTGAPLTQAAQARAELLIQDREEAAILVNTNTMAPQTPYSTPRLAWRPNGSGIYVTSDDGVVRGFDASTGKPVVALSAHEPGSKVRCVWAGYTEEETERENQYRSEYLISGGFDQKLICWTADSDDTIG